MKQQISHNTKSKLPLSASTVTSAPSPSSWSCPARLGLSQRAFHASARHLALGQRRGAPHQASGLPQKLPGFSTSLGKETFAQVMLQLHLAGGKERLDTWLGGTSSFLNPLLGDTRSKQCCAKQAGQGVALPSPISILSRWML